MADLTLQLDIARMEMMRFRNALALERKNNAQAKKYANSDKENDHTTINNEHSPDNTDTTYTTKTQLTLKPISASTSPNRQHRPVTRQEFLLLSVQMRRTHCGLSEILGPTPRRGNTLQEALQVQLRAGLQKFNQNKANDQRNQQHKEVAKQHEWQHKHAEEEARKKAMSPSMI